MAEKIGIWEKTTEFGIGSERKIDSNVLLPELRT